MKHRITKHSSKKIDNAFIAILVPLILMSIIIIALKEFWVVLTPIAIVILGIILFKRIKKQRILNNLGAGYTVRKHCPNCGRLNDFHYPMGSPSKGIIKYCTKCGTQYS